MTKDIIDIRLSTKASEVANRFKDNFFFSDAISVAKLGFAYMIQTAEEKDLLYWQTLSDRKKDERFETNGYNYGGASIDKGGKMVSLIKAKFPECETPYLYIRLLMDVGLCELGKKVSTLDELLSFVKRMD